MKTDFESLEKFIKESLQLEMQPWQRKIMKLLWEKHQRGERVYIEADGAQLRKMKKFAQYHMLNNLPTDQKVTLFCPGMTQVREAKKYITNPNVKIITMAEAELRGLHQ